MDEFIPIAGIAMVTILGSIPLIGLTIRYAIKPAVESIVLAMREARAGSLGPGVDERLESLEAQVDSIRASVTHLVETQDFDRDLSSGTPSEPRVIEGPNT